MYRFFECLAYIALGAAIGVAVFMKEAFGHGVPNQEHHLVDTPRIHAYQMPVMGTSKAARSAQLLKIAIIDTGYNPKLVPDGIAKLKLCSEGHYDFFTKRPVVNATHWHGTVTGSIIASFLRDVNYCAIIYQVADDAGISAENIAGALHMAAREGLTAINLSLEGTSFNSVERFAFYDVTSKGTIVFIAAGNRDKNLDIVCNSYPTCYHLPNTYIVGALSDEGDSKAGYSNYGKEVNAWYQGSVEFGGQIMRGTSFAAPRALGDFVQSFSSRLAGQ